MSIHVFSEAWIKCRLKRPNCCWCGESIDTGESAVYQVRHQDGGICTARMHPECHAANDAWLNPIGRQGEAPDTGEFGRGEVFKAPDTLRFTPEDCRLNPNRKLK